MKVRFLISGDSPETGPFTAGEERDIPDTTGELFVRRALVAEKIDDKPAPKAADKKEADNGK